MLPDYVSGADSDIGLDVGSVEIDYLRQSAGLLVGTSICISFLYLLVPIFTALKNYRSLVNTSWKYIFLFLKMTALSFCG